MTWRPHSSVEIPTLLMMALCYVLWFAAMLWIAEFSWVLASISLPFIIALHSSLQHEVLHGHPLPSKFWSEMLVAPAVGLFIPYQRFRDLHLQHHIDPNLTDPYEDPETNFLDPDVWAELPRAYKTVLQFNNTLAGRMLIGPLISQWVFLKSDFALIRSGNRSVMKAWLLHLAGSVPVVVIVVEASALSFWWYLAAAYGGLSILKVRTYLEHRAHESPRGRTAIVEDRGLWSWMFLNNNLHLVHHMHPFEPWYKLPALFDRNMERFLGDNEGYSYRRYSDIFTKYFFKAKDPVPHPIWKRR